MATKIRATLAQLVWLACALAALVLAAGALLIALDANRSNELVDAVLTAASWADLDVFSRQDGIKQFRGEGAEVKNALFNWGLAAIAWLARSVPPGTLGESCVLPLCSPCHAAQRPDRHRRPVHRPPSRHRAAEVPRSA